jgi:hypothetical protein
MTDNRSLGRKKSNFPQRITVNSSDTFDFVSEGTNFKIPFSDFLSNLGALGTLEQEGAVTGTPVLDAVLDEYKIRNLENGSGVKASVSPENGITLDHNFITDTAGAELVVDLSATQPKFRSLVAGSGISVGASNGSIQIALSGTPTTTKTVIVNSITDFPTAVAGVIALEDETEYAIRNDITTSNRFVLGNNTVLDGSDSLVINLEYTNSGVMFTSLNTNWTLKNITTTCSSGTFIDFDGTGSEVLQVLNCVIITDILGTIDDARGVNFSANQLSITTNGFEFGGANSVVLVESTLATIAAGTLFSLNAATFGGFSVTDGFYTLNGTSVFISGAASSANIDVGSLGSVHNCRFFGPGTILQTITIFDLRWQFFINNGIEDTHKDCLVSLTNNATATVISAVNTPTLIAGTWVPEHESQFVGDANGRCTYVGTDTIHIDISISISAAPVSGSNKIIGHYAAKNGVEISASEAKNNISSGDLSRTTVLWRIILATNDYIEAFIENETDAVDILVTDAVLRIS